MSTQLSMFTTGEDLPLFSGTAPAASIAPFAPTPEAGRQDPLPAACRFCQDTGKLAGDAFCWCDAGQAARARAAAAR